MFVNIDQLAQLYRQAGIKNVDILPGAHNRAAKMYAASGYPNGVQMLDQHHTAQSIGMAEINSIQYMTFWAPYPKICNTYPWKNGRLTICCAGPTYTAGAGGPLGSVTAGNAAGWSREIGNNGIGEPYPDAQIDTVLRATAVEVEYFGNLFNWEDPWSWWRVPAHHEWTIRKVDPFGPATAITGGRNIEWPMEIFRSKARDLQNTLYNHQGEAMLKALKKPERIYDSRRTNQPFAAGESRAISIGKFANFCAVNITVVSDPGSLGHATVAGVAGAKGTSTTNLDQDGIANGNYTGAAVNGEIHITVHGATSHVMVDLSTFGTAEIVDS